MTRPTDWWPLGLLSDPVWGDPGQVSLQADKLIGVADDIRQASDNLSKVVENSDQRSLAVVAFSQRAHEVAGQIRSAESRYRGAGDALAAYSTKLRAAQQKSFRALEAARVAGNSLATATKNEAFFSAEAQRPGPPELQGANRARATIEVRKAETSSSELDSARSLLSEAIAERDRAATEACNDISDVESSSALRNDSVVEKALDGAGDLISDFVSGFAQMMKIIWDNIDTIAIVFTVAAGVALAVGAAPVAAVLVSIAMVARAVATIKVATDTVLLVGRAIRGEVTAGEFAWAMGGLAAGYVLGKGGKIVGSRYFKKGKEDLFLEEKILAKNVRTLDAPAVGAQAKRLTGASLSGSDIVTAPDHWIAAGEGGSAYSLELGGRLWVNRATAEGPDGAAGAASGTATAADPIVIRQHLGTAFRYGEATNRADLLQPSLGGVAR